MNHKIYSSLQEVFDTSVAGLASQGFNMSISSDGSCAYRGKDGCRCPIGWLIPDELYSPNMENILIGGLLYGKYYPNLVELFSPTISAQDLAALQYRHDVCQSLRGWKIDVSAKMREELCEFAAWHKLTLPVVLQQ
jgi:hypothetical protein